MKWQALNASEHLHHGWRRPAGVPNARNDAWALLVLSELPLAQAQYPLAFARLPEGEFRLGALLGLCTGQNLWLNEQARWRGGYVPSCYRGHPFALQRMADGGDELRAALCFDVDSGLYRESPDPAQGEQRFFDDSGQPHAVTQQLLQFLQKRWSDHARTQAAAAALAQAGLLVPWVWPDNLPLPPGAQPLKGLYRVDESRLNQLPAADLQTLRDTQALTVAYAQMFSMHRMAGLQAMAEKQLAVPAAPPPPDLDAVKKMFEPGQSDTLQFNW